MSQVLSIRLLVALLFLQGSIVAEEAAERFLREAVARAEYWQARGYKFNPLVMSADTMDRKVRDIERANYWNERGYKFDPTHTSAWTMDQHVAADERAKYWRQWGIEFDPNLLDARSMDQAALQLQWVRDVLRGVPIDKGGIVVVSEGKPPKTTAPGPLRTNSPLAGQTNAPTNLNTQRRQPAVIAVFPGNTGGGNLRSGVRSTNQPTLPRELKGLPPSIAGEYLEAFLHWQQSRK